MQIGGSGDRRPVGIRRRHARRSRPCANSRPAIGCTPSALQQVVVDRRRPDAQRTIAGGEVDFAGRVGANRRKRLVELAEFEIFRRRHPELIEPERRELGGQVHQLFGLRIAQRTQDHAVDDRENRGICANSERERQNRDRRERGRAQQASDSETDILAKIIEAHGGL